MDALVGPPLGPAGCVLLLPLPFLLLLLLLVAVLLVLLLPEKRRSVVEESGVRTAVRKIWPGTADVCPDAAAECMKLCRLPRTKLGSRWGRWGAGASDAGVLAYLPLLPLLQPLLLLLLLLLPLLPMLLLLLLQGTPPVPAVVRVVGRSRLSRDRVIAGRWSFTRWRKAAAASVAASDG